MNKKVLSLTLATIGLTAAAAYAATNSVSFSQQGDKRCVASNGIPDHATGQFPNRGNPNSMREQRLKYCVDATPTKGSRPTDRAKTIGVALNGVPIRPGTADWYDASSPRGHSRDRSSGWNLEGLGSREKLGMDHNHAHVDHQGLYHYHGMPNHLANLNGGSLMGYAADGFEIHYIGQKATSSYKLKPGNRPTPPYGRYDGQFEQDWGFKAGSGNLDRCNGAETGRGYAYFATDSFPFFPRCHWGEVSSDFVRKGGPGGKQGKRPPKNGHRPPPPKKKKWW
ncbi:YHYH protein [Alphaproteobacteria bacterium]|jgi:hypothetical protein|nr:YHYH protein [Alphaproteobacteria bacterium]